jgi:transcriptional regulator with XRE-family HTH domain
MNGNLGDWKRVGARVHEARLNFGTGYRVYFGIDGSTLTILLIGGDKASQRQDIVTAKQFWSDYRRSQNAKAIRAYGVREFAKAIKMAESNLVRLLSGRSNPTQETLNRLLKPFGLRLAVTPIPSIKPKKAS